jgi:hypothetical protein
MAVGILREMDKLNSRHCERGLLEEILPLLPNLIAITATSSYPFDGCEVDLKPAWKYMTIEDAPRSIELADLLLQDRKTSVSRYTNILLATGKTFGLGLLDPSAHTRTITLHRQWENSLASCHNYGGSI